MHNENNWIHLIAHVDGFLCEVTVSERYSRFGASLALTNFIDS